MEEKRGEERRRRELTRSGSTAAKEVAGASPEFQKKNKKRRKLEGEEEESEGEGESEWRERETGESESEGVYIGSRRGGHHVREREAREERERGQAWGKKKRDWGRERERDEWRR